MVCISQSTECGSIYSKAEITALSEKCRQHDMLLYVDGLIPIRLVTAWGTEESYVDIFLSRTKELLEAYTV